MAVSSRVNLKSVALPTEHGGWSFLAEPIVLGLLVAPTWKGFVLGLAVVSLFLLHQPLKIAMKDNLKQRRVARTQWAERFVMLYGGLGISFVLILIAMNGANFLLPMIIGSIFALVQVAYDARNQSRELVPELTGSIALAATASSIALLAGWSMTSAMMLWLILAARAVTAIIYVRVRLRMVHDKPHNKSFALALHIFALCLFVLLVVVKVIPFTVIIAMSILVVRAFKGMLHPAPHVTAKVIGLTELAIGIVYILTVSVGYWLLL
jgi:hypothetical protein